MPSDASIFLSATHLSKQVISGGTTITILRDITLSVKQAESLAIIGSSGSGKTTLLTLLAGIDVPTTGDIYIKSQHVTSMNEDERANLRKQSVGFIFQSFNLIPTLNAVENVALPLDIRGIPHHQAIHQASEWLERMGLKERLSHYPRTLSGGEQQRVAIARAFVGQPEIIFADEMTGNLDTETGERIIEELFTLNRDMNTTLVLVTHDEQLAKKCQRRLLLQQGMLQPC